LRAVHFSSPSVKIGHDWKHFTYPVLAIVTHLLSYQGHALIETLHAVQQSFGYLDEEALRFVVKALHLPPSRVYGVATSYNFFTLKPQGVETFANIAPIISRGPEWYAGFRTEKSKGTKVFALTGKIRNTGLIEVPVGITIREIVEELGCGVPEGAKLKAVQTGGPSDGCIPAEHFDASID
jgi:hypothetical protein